MVYNSVFVPSPPRGRARYRSWYSPSASKTPKFPPAPRKAGGRCLETRKTQKTPLNHPSQHARFFILCKNNTILFSPLCGYHVSGPTRLRKMSKLLLPSRLGFWKPCSGSSGHCHVWKLATEPSPHSAEGFSAADISPGGFSAAGLWKAPLDGPLTRVPRER